MYRSVENITYEQLLRETSTEKKAIEFAIGLGLIASSKLCGVCGSFMYIDFKRGRARRAATWRCPINHTQRQEVSVRNGTFFEQSRLPIQKIVRLMFLWAVDNQDTVTLRRELQIGLGAITDWKQFCRDVCIQKMSTTKIGGPGVRVEIDESVIARRKYNRGCRVNQLWMFGGYEPRRKIGFLVAVRKRNARTLLPLIRKHIRRGSVIASDEWKAYSRVDRMRGRNYRHVTVNHSLWFTDPVTGVTTNHIESMWQKVKSAHKARFGTDRKLLNSYLAEFMWRQRYARPATLAFQNFVRHVRSYYPVNE